MDSFLKGAFAGGFAVGCTYPLDTIKTRLQSGALFNRYLYSSPFIGIGAPMAAVMLEKSLLFSAFESLKHIRWTQHSDTANNFINGVNAGLLTTFVVTPFERVKIRAQIDRSLGSLDAVLHIYKKEGILGFGRGWTATLFREVPGYGFYFSTLTYCQKIWPCSAERTDMFYQNLAKQWFIGGLTGLVPWIFIYPSDIVKTTMQAENWPLRRSARYIYQNGGLPAFYRGYYVGLARAFFMHSFVILGYHFANLMYPEFLCEP